MLLLALAGMEGKSKAAQHSTGYLAGAFAEAVRTRHLVLTHFSARYSFVQASDRRSQVRRIWAQGGIDELMGEALKGSASGQKVFLSVTDIQPHFCSGANA